MEIYRNLPQFKLAEMICEKLAGQGYTAYLAGGCVRDFLLSRSPNDFDVATSATPEQVEKLFSKTVAVGRDFGVMVVVEEINGSSEQVEVATFREDGKYQDGRRPETVNFTNAKEDALRRDFTINALFYDFKNKEILDFVGGKQDLQKRIIRTVGLPEKRFSEDHLRILRAIRFSSQLGFEIEGETFQACVRLAGLVQSVSGERIQEEMKKLLHGEHLTLGLRQLFDAQVLHQLLGFAELKWVKPEPYFVPNQNSMFGFFVWVYFASDRKINLEFFEQLSEKWKFSRDLKLKTIRSMSWFFKDQPFRNHSLGELLALSFSFENFQGLMAYGKHSLQDSETSAYDSFLKRKNELGEGSVTPWITANDLKGICQGEEMGRALKICFWKQLEGKFSNRDELWNWWLKSNRNAIQKGNL